MTLKAHGIALPWTLAPQYAASFPDAASYVDRIADITGYKGWFRSVADEITLVSSAVNVIADASGNGTTAFASSTGPTRAALLADGLDVPRAGEQFPIIRSTGGTPAPYRFDGSWDGDVAFTMVMYCKLRAWPTSTDVEGLITSFSNATDRAYLHVIGNDPGFVRYALSGSDGFMKGPMALDEWTLLVASFTPGSPNTARLEINGVRVADVTWTGTPANGAIPVIGGFSFSGSSGAKELDWSDAMLFQSDLFLDPAALALVKGYFNDLHGVPM